MTKSTPRKSKSPDGRRATKLTLTKDILKDLTTPATVKGGSGTCGRSR